MREPVEEVLQLVVIIEGHQRPMNRLVVHVPSSFGAYTFERSNHALLKPLTTALRAVPMEPQLDEWCCFKDKPNGRRERGQVGRVAIVQRHDGQNEVHQDGESDE